MSTANCAKQYAMMQPQQLALHAMWHTQHGHTITITGCGWDGTHSLTRSVTHNTGKRPAASVWCMHGVFAFA